MIPAATLKTALRELECAADDASRLPLSTATTFIVVAVSTR
jgi:hypothetical protein